MLWLVLAFIFEVSGDNSCSNAEGTREQCSLGSDRLQIFSPLNNLTRSDSFLVSRIVGAKSRRPTKRCNQNKVFAAKRKINMHKEWMEFFASEPKYQSLAALHTYLQEASSKKKYKKMISRFFLLDGDQAIIEKEIVNSLLSKLETSQNISLKKDTWLTLGTSNIPGHFGKDAYFLFIEGHLQSTSVDEHIYHEIIVHPALISHETGALSVFIGGGAEGFTLREVLRHHSVQSVVMVDIDGPLMDACGSHLSNLTQKSFRDPRAQVFSGDARAYLEQRGTDLPNFDVIVLDFPEFYIDYVQCQRFLGGLFSVEFYTAAKHRLRPGGILIAQAPMYDECAVLTTLRKVFRSVVIAVTPMFSYPANLFFLASDNLPPFETMTPSEVDARIAARIKEQLYFYEGRTHAKLWSLNASIASSHRCKRQACMFTDFSESSNRNLDACEV